MSTRIRNVVDDRHMIRDPYGAGPNDLAIFTNTLLKERVATLYKSAAGLAGHALQIEMELNRLEGKNRALSADQLSKGKAAAKFIRQSIVKAKEGSAIAGHWRLHHQN